MRYLASVAILLFAGCASGHSQTGGDDDSVPIDANIDVPDAEPHHDIDAMPITSIDAAPGAPDANVPVPPDANVPPPDATPACTPITQQKLTNGGFESCTGTAPGPYTCPSWTQLGQDPSLEPVVKDGDGGPASQSAPAYVWLGGVHSSTDALYQQITLPADATNMQISLYKLFATNETSGTHDTLKVQIRSTADTVLETVVTYSNLNAGDSAWVPITLTPSSSYAGQTVRLYFQSVTDADPTPTNTTDNAGITNFFLDTTSLTVLACP